MKSIEEELEALVLASDYRVAISGDCYLHIGVHYMPAQRSVDVGGRMPLVVQSGQIGYALFSGPAWWRWRRARRFVKATIAGHRELLRATGIIQA